MAKTVTISKSEYEYLLESNKTDGLTIAQLQAQLAQAKADIQRLLILGRNYQSCEFCARNPMTCEGCENAAEWRGCKNE